MLLSGSGNIRSVPEASFGGRSACDDGTSSLPMKRIPATKLAGQIHVVGKRDHGSSSARAKPKLTRLIFGKLDLPTSNCLISIAGSYLSRYGDVECMLRLLTSMILAECTRRVKSRRGWNRS